MCEVLASIFPLQLFCMELVLNSAQNTKIFSLVYPKNPKNGQICLLFFKLRVDFINFLTKCRLTSVFLTKPRLSNVF